MTRAQLVTLESKRLDAVRELAQQLIEWPRQAQEVLVEHGGLEEHPEITAVKMRLDLLHFLEAHASQLSPAVQRLVGAPIPVHYPHDYGSRADFEAHRRHLQESYGAVYGAPRPGDLQVIDNDFAGLERFLAQDSHQTRTAQQFMEEVQQMALQDAPPPAAS